MNLARNVSRGQLARSIARGILATAACCTVCLAVGIDCKSLDSEEPAAQRETADVILRNGKIYTFESSGSTVDSIVVTGERIVFTGPREQADKYRQDSTRVIDLNGKTMLPGFTDAHVHPVHGGLTMLECDFTGIEHLADVLAKLTEYAGKNAEKPWVRGANVSLAIFPDGNPDKRLLDEIIDDRPVYVRSADGHNAWVNSKALQLAGISADTPDPPKGRIERDPDTGEPSGTLREGAMSIVQKVLPRYTHAERVEAIRRGLKLANSLGITNLVEANASEGDILAYLELADAGELTAHVNVSIGGDISRGAECVRRVLQLQEAFGRGRTRSDDLAFGQAKLFMDGVVEGKTAAMLEPYSGQAHNGTANTDPETANAVIAELDRAGHQLHVHAIGDRAIRMTLDAIEHARNANGARDARHHVAHLHVIHPDDIHRFKELDVVANFQSLWATLEDSYMTNLNLPFLGPKRAEWQYPIGSVARSGARLAFGSDWPVSTMNPFHAAQVAINRRGPDNEAREPWTPQHLIDLRSVMEGYTKGGAWLTFREAETGTLEPGKLANLIVVDRDVFSISGFELFETRVHMTMFRGRIVFGDN